MPRAKVTNGSTPRTRLTRYAEACDIALIFFEPPAHFDDAILGLVHGFNQPPVVLYDQAKVLAALIADGMSAADAEEWFAYNCIGSYLGEATPRFLCRGVEDA